VRSQLLKSGAISCSYSLFFCFFDYVKNKCTHKEGATNCCGYEALRAVVELGCTCATVPITAASGVQQGTVLAVKVYPATVVTGGAVFFWFFEQDSVTIEYVGFCIWIMFQVIVNGLFFFGGWLSDWWILDVSPQFSTRIGIIPRSDFHHHLSVWIDIIPRSESHHHSAVS